MPVIFTNWKINKVGSEIFFESWVPISEHSRFRTMKTISKYYTTGDSFGSGVQGIKSTQFYQYIIPLNGLKLKNYTSGTKGWTFILNGETILIMFSSRVQNPRYPQQTLQEIEEFINEVNSGISTHI